MARTVERYVGDVMDNASLSGMHYKIFGLIAAGYFFDIANLAIYGTLVPQMLSTGFATKAQVAIVGSASLFGLAIGAAGQGEFTDRFGRKAVYQFNLLLFGVATLASAFAPDYKWLAVFRFIAGIGLGAEQPLCFAYAGEYAPKSIRGRILAGVHFIGGACSWPIATVFSLFFISTIEWRGCFAVLGVGALVVFILRFTLPESPRWLAANGRGKEALDILPRIGLPKPAPGETLVDEAAAKAHKDPILIVLKNFPFRLLAGMICFIAFFGCAIGLSTWLPNMMAQTRGMTITTSLTYTLVMTCAVPCSSAFMMWGIERFGRKKTAVCAFACAGIAAVGFVNAPTNEWMLFAGFWMIFFIQLAGNCMQILISEVFPTQARATGFGLCSGVGRLGTAFIIPTILWIQNGYGINAVFAAVAALLVVAGIFVPLAGPEGQGRSLDDLAKTPEDAKAPVTLRQRA